MRILLLGASGRTGKHVLTEAFARSHTVTALVRRPEALNPRDGLTIHTGSPLSKSDIHAAFASAPSSDPVKVVINTLATSRASDSPWAAVVGPMDLLLQSASNTVEVMKELKYRNCRKFVSLGTVGVGTSERRPNRMFKFIVDHSNLKVAFEDHYEVQKYLEGEAGKGEGLKWCDVRAVGLSNGVKKEAKVFPEDGTGLGWLPMISRETVATFLVDVAEREEWDGKTPVIA